MGCFGARVFTLGWVALACAALATVAPASWAADTVTETYTTAGQHSFTVLTGVQRVAVTATGGRGGHNMTGNPSQAGRPARVTATIPVHPGQTLYAVVGSGAGGPVPGVNGGGGVFTRNLCPFDPGAGGGASDVRTKPVSASESASSRLLVAGGGGGAGGSSVDTSAATGKGGDAGVAGGRTDGGDGGAAGAGGFGGAGGGANPLEPVDIADGGDGTPTRGGWGGLRHGGGPIDGGCGGGGGGGYGGGGGGRGASPFRGGAGGGGGGSLDPDGGAPPEIAAIATPASITITYTVLSPAAVAVALDPAILPPDGISQTKARATVTAADGTPLEDQTVTFTSSDPGQTIDSVVELGDGVYEATVRSSQTPGTATITAVATDGAATATGTTTLTQPAAVSPWPVAPASPPAPAVGKAPVGKVSVGKVSVPKQTPKVRNGAFKLKLKCSGAPLCNGVIAVKTRAGKTAATAKRFGVTLGTRSVTVKLTAAARRALKRNRQLTVTVTATVGGVRTRRTLKLRG